MVAIADLDLPILNPTDPQFDNDIYGYYEKARAENWLAATPMGVMVLGYTEMKELLLKDDKLEPANRMMTSMLGAEGTSFGDFIALLRK